MTRELDQRNLPTAVLERLSGVDANLLRDAGYEAVQRGNLLEVRSAKVETRVNEDGTVGLRGYATVYEYAYDVAGGPPYGWSETIAAGACAKSVRERDDVRLLFDHDGIPLARTRSRTMTLESDDDGLRVDVPALDVASPLVQSIRSAMDRGDLDEMSFAFKVLRQEWNADYTERRITEVKLYDVSVVTFPANPAAVASLSGGASSARSGYPLALARAEAEALRLRR